MDELKKKCKNELSSFFGLSVFNIVIAALTLGLGVSVVASPLLTLIQSGQLQLIILLQIIPGMLAVGAGFYWLIKTAEILDGIDDISSAYETIRDYDDEEEITGILVKMMAHYRKNRPTIHTMNLFGRIGGIVFLVVGFVSVVSAIYMLATLGVNLAGLGQLAGGIVAAGVGIGSLLIAKYFKRYSGVWDTRLQQEDGIHETLNMQLGSS